MTSTHQRPSKSLWHAAWAVGRAVGFWGLLGNLNSSSQHINFFGNYLTCIRNFCGASGHLRHPSLVSSLPAHAACHYMHRYFTFILKVLVRKQHGPQLCLNEIAMASNTYLIQLDHLTGSSGAPARLTRIHSN